MAAEVVQAAQVIFLLQVPCKVVVAVVAFAAVQVAAAVRALLEQVVDLAVAAALPVMEPTAALVVVQLVIRVMVVKAARGTAVAVLLAQVAVVAVALVQDSIPEVAAELEFLV